jgi:hypothetical protein
MQPDSTKNSIDRTTLRRTSSPSFTPPLDKGLLNYCVTAFGWVPRRPGGVVSRKTMVTALMAQTRAHARRNTCVIGSRSSRRKASIARHHGAGGTPQWVVLLAHPPDKVTQVSEQTLGRPGGPRNFQRQPQKGVRLNSAAKPSRLGATSSTPTTPSHYHAIADAVVHASGRRLQAGVAT